eukprot:TRINITY_DN12280_c0_g1_i3.p1 TRINITY_DN12280_c0_g1~~TRINITY_DN12280_c0_g1_i3.p1  ORF type:complete len:549 (+),score=59.23 TRINITY_DN12280_c0_g1_i3:171-1649(+)
MAPGAGTDALPETYLQMANMPVEVHGLPQEFAHYNGRQGRVVGAVERNLGDLRLPPGCALVDFGADRGGHAYVPVGNLRRPTPWTPWRSATPAAPSGELPEGAHVAVEATVGGALAVAASVQHLPSAGMRIAIAEMISTLHYNREVVRADERTSVLFIRALFVHKRTPAPMARAELTLPYTVQLCRGEEIRLEQCLGQGNYGVVYRASRAGKEDMAFKIATSKNGPEPLQRLRSGLHRLDCAHLATATMAEAVEGDCARLAQLLFGELDSGFSYWALMQLGGDNLHLLLRSMRDEGRRPPPASVAAWAVEFTAGVRFMHENGYVHTDLKTANTVVKGDKLLIIDLDDAVLEGAQDGGNGTFGFQEPMALWNEAWAATKPCDMWAVGVWLHHVFTTGCYPPGIREASFAAAQGQFTEIQASRYSPPPTSITNFCFQKPDKRISAGQLHAMLASRRQEIISRMSDSKFYKSEFYVFNDSSKHVQEMNQFVHGGR